LDNADGLWGLDLDLGYVSSLVTVVGIRTLELGARCSVASNDVDGHLRLGLFSPVALEGPGSILAIETEVGGVSRGARFSIEAHANEGQIPLRVRGGGPGPRQLPADAGSRRNSPR
jgi:hypothetical protein